MLAHGKFHNPRELLEDITRLLPFIFPKKKKKVIVKMQIKELFTIPCQIKH